MEKFTGLVINEDAYLSEEEENALVLKVDAFKKAKKMSLEEEEEFWGKMPALRRYADLDFRTDGAEEYYKSEKKNIELIKTKAWEVYEELI